MSASPENQITQNIRNLEGLQKAKGAPRNYGDVMQQSTIRLHH